MAVVGSIEHGAGSHRRDPPPWGALPGHPSAWPTPLQADLLRAALLPDERALAAWERIRPALRVEEMDYATQAVLPQLRSNLLSLGVEDELLALFKGVHRYTWARNHLLLAQGMPIVAALERAGIPTLLLKGAALVGGRRQDAGMRKMNDVDVLVPTATRASACQVLVDQGMAPLKGAPLWYVTEVAPAFTPSFGFVNAAEAHLDLHWHALHYSCESSADEDFWAAAVPIELGGVATRSLCPADELLLLISHGLRWAQSPTYRWVLDATQVARGLGGLVDYERLGHQARRHRLATLVGTGLRYLGELAGVEVPAGAMRTLRVAAPFQRFELRAHSRRPSRRGPAEQAAIVHGQYLRHRVPVGTRVTPATHVRLARERLGIVSWSDLRRAGAGGRPGPGRPYMETEAPIGTGACDPPALAWGDWLEFGRPENVHAHCCHGLCYPEGRGSWIAGREARLALELPEPASSSLVLELAAWGLVTEECPGQRLEVLLDHETVSRLQFDADRRSVEAEAILLPARLIQGRSRLEGVLRAPDATSPARLGINDDVRRLGVCLQRLRARPPRRCARGQRIAFGAGSGDQGILAGGWAEADPGGRWTLGAEARLLLEVDAELGVLQWSADPLLPPGAPPLQVEVRANGLELGIVDCSAAPATVELPLGNVGPAGELLLSWHIREPRRPSQFLASEDRRPLGLFFRSITLS